MNMYSKYMLKLINILSGEVLAWLSVWSEEWGASDLHMVQLTPLPPHHLLLQ